MRPHSVALRAGAASLLAVLAPLAASTVPAGFDEVLVTDGLTRPVQMVFAPDGRLFVTERDGAVRIVDGAVLRPTPFATVEAKVGVKYQGLFGIDLDPAFATNGFVYLLYVARDDRIRIARLTAGAADPDRAAPGSEVVLLGDLPVSNHLGGGLVAAADGNLYITLGDGQTGGAPAQDLADLRGKVLRIASDGRIPADNPFRGVAGAREEVYALGFRQPFSLAEDPLTGAIWVNDVGGEAWADGREEIDDLVAGANYGWPHCEGACNDPAHRDPVYAYPFAQSAAITGGAFNRAGAFPASYRGAFFFGDHQMGWIAYRDAGGAVHDFATGTTEVVDIAISPAGDLYWLSHRGELYRVRAEAPGATRRIGAARVGDHTWDIAPAAPQVVPGDPIVFDGLDPRADHVLTPVPVAAN